MLLQVAVLVPAQHPSSLADPIWIHLCDIASARFLKARLHCAIFAAILSAIFSPGVCERVDES
jgi:hypothetical protein